MEQLAIKNIHFISEYILTYNKMKQYVLHALKVLKHKLFYVYTYTYSTTLYIFTIYTW